MMAAIDSTIFQQPFLAACLVLAVVMLVWDTIEVGRNDAANLVNAVFGSRVLRHRTAILVAGVAVVCGATLGSDVIDTARKGIFTPDNFKGVQFGLQAVLTIYVSVYIVDTVLLYGYSGFGMPVSTTACLVFELLGAALAMDLLTDADSVNWSKSGKVVIAIVCSIAMSGVVAFLIQRAVRGAIRDRTTHHATLLLHGGWVGGGMAAGLFYFLLLKGMKDITWVKVFRTEIVEQLGHAVVIFAFWAFFAVVIHLALVRFRQRAADLLFPALAVLGTLAMAFAFGQNDLANCASPGLASIHLIQKGDLHTASKVPIETWMLFACGLLLFWGMTRPRARRVTKAAVSTGSMGDHVALWAPRWCVSLAEYLLRFRSKAPALAPRPSFTEAGKAIHFDALRASVIMAVSASVIATASSMGLPVSTTYVTFAAVVATGMADRIFQRGDAALKLGRAIWVITSWFLAALIAAVAAGLVATAIFRLEIWGMGAVLILNLVLRQKLKTRSDLHQRRVKEQAYERAHPEEFALEDERF